MTKETGEIKVTQKIVHASDDPSLAGNVSDNYSEECAERDRQAQWQSLVDVAVKQRELREKKNSQILSASNAAESDSSDGQIITNRGDIFNAARRLQAREGIEGLIAAAVGRTPGTTHVENYRSKEKSSENSITF